MLQYLWIGLGGFIGANTRYLLQQWAANRWGADFPYGTLLVSHAQRRVVVVDNRRRVVGIITDGDLIKQATAAERGGIIESLTRRLPPGQADTFQLSQRTAAEVMTSQVVTVTPETPLREALRLLLEHKIKRLPVVDANGRLVGLVGRGGILQALGQSSGAGTSAD